MVQLSLVYVTYRPGGYDILLDSVKNQTFRDFELIVVDELTHRRDKVLKYFTRCGDITTIVTPSKPKAFPKHVYGLLNAFNTGVIESSGEYIVILDDYTWLPPDSLQRFMNHKQKMDEGYCISATAKNYMVSPKPFNLEHDLYVFEKPLKGKLEDNGFSTYQRWIPNKFELFYSCIPYSILEKINGFPECWDYYPNKQIDPFMKAVEDVDGKLMVDKNNVCEMINHRNWGGGLWHLSKISANYEKDYKFVECPNPFNIDELRKNKT